MIPRGEDPHEDFADPDPRFHDDADPDKDTGKFRLSKLKFFFLNFFWKIVFKSPVAGLIWVRK